jgi:hypothetical protein
MMVIYGLENNNYKLLERKNDLRQTLRVLLCKRFFFYSNKKPGWPKIPFNFRNFR